MQKNTTTATTMITIKVIDRLELFRSVDGISIGVSIGLLVGTLVNVLVGVAQTELFSVVYVVGRLETCEAFVVPELEPGSRALGRKRPRSLHISPAIAEYRLLSPRLHRRLEIHSLISSRCEDGRSPPQGQESAFLVVTLHR